MRKIRNWQGVIEKLNASKSGKLVVEMGSPGSAQVTRVRLLSEYANLEASTKGAKLVLKVAA